jgi:hypothetical protein
LSARFDGAPRRLALTAPLKRRRAPPWRPRLLLVAGLVVLPAGARADGGFFYPLYMDVWEPSQTGLLLHDESSGREDLYLRVGFEGTARDFGWIVPVPSLPQVEAAPPDLFFECAVLTEPIVRERGMGCLSGDAGRTLAPGDVEVYDDRRIGLYHSMVVGASDASALADSLTRWGFLHAQNREQATAALQHYVDRSWFFAVFRIDPAQVPGETGVWGGTLDPVHLTFASARPVYPLRISALSAAALSEVLLYVCAERRLTFPGARTEYANRIDAGELAAIRRRHASLGPLLAEGRFLTKLRRAYRPEEMADDLVLEPASSDEELRTVYYGGIPAAEVLLLLGLVFTAVASRRRRPIDCAPRHRLSL